MDYKITKGNWILVLGFVVFVGVILLVMQAPDPSQINLDESPTKGDEEVRYFNNPIVNGGADPWMIEHEGFYYLIQSTGRAIQIYKSENITNIESGVKITVFSAPKGTDYSENLWAPEIHMLDGKWYIYFTAGSESPNYQFGDQRVFVLEAKTNDPMGEYEMKGRLAAETDKWAIDGSVIEYNKEKYVIWSGWPGDVNIQQNIYIAKLKNPWTISGDRVLLSEPEFDWERKGGPPFINEGPRPLYKNDKIHIVYSAAGSWTNFYCLGLLTFSGGDILNPDAWSKSDEPVFETGNGVYGPARASFVKSPDKTQDWMIYHSARSVGSGWDRVIRAQPFTWNDDDSPNFGEPNATLDRIEFPSGENPKENPK